MPEEMVINVIYSASQELDGGSFFQRLTPNDIGCGLAAA